MLVTCGRLAAAQPRENPANDCLIGVQHTNGTFLTEPLEHCIDGTACDTDDRANGRCRIALHGCFNLPDVPGCVPRPLRRARFELERSRPLRGRRFERLPLPETGPEAEFACGPSERLRLDTDGDDGSPEMRQIRAKATAAVRPRRKHRDTDRLAIQCDPCPAGETNRRCLVAQTCTSPCLDAAQGGARLTFAVDEHGSDLDVGWTGVGHGFRLPSGGGTISACVTQCTAGDTRCEVCGNTGEETPNGEVFGPPVPLFASGVPLCLINRWTSVVGGTADPITGHVTLDLALATEVHLTDSNSVCPQCKNGACNSGTRAGSPCTVDATAPVYVSPTRTDSYALSSSCTPTAPSATAELRLALSTATTAPLVGPTPCTAQPGEPVGAEPLPDACGDGTCDAPCTGPACIAMVPDPADPARLVCLDAKGGLNEQCCSTSTLRPCHPLRGGGSVVRTGSATIPTSVDPGVAYPKQSDAVLVSAFCLPSTGTNTIDLVWGLPGPALLTMPAAVQWSQD